ncbi:sensor histidine kinase [Micromonospora sp. SL1-18]|uniref:sensor histidine kinase n=1 Tax=Micromonospora sp. SL1-18 TaxID=3399128 RepID=UPI003A4DE2C0
MGFDLGWRAYRPDLVLAVAVGGALLASALLAPSGSTDLNIYGYLLLMVGPLALVAARRAPVAVLLVITVWTLLFHLRVVPGLLAAFPVGVVGAAPALIAVYIAMRAGRRWPAVAAAVALVPGALAAGLAGASPQPAPELVETRLLLAGWLVAAGVLGEVSRQRTAYLRQVEQRAVDAERTREETARRRAGEERLRIARELHDSLTHSISVIKVQAGVVIHLARKRGEEVPEALLAIQEASTDAIRELRATLEVLRRPEPEPAGGGLDRLPELVERSRQAGTPASVTVSGAPRVLPGEVDRAAYRIVQEALTNVARHAGPASASVHIGYESAALTVQVDDDGRAAPPSTPATGVGLIGMRERVAALGGRIRAGHRPDGGFTVRAELPVGGVR